MLLLDASSCIHDETCIAWAITALLVLLMITFFASNVLHALHWTLVPESCVFILIGMVFAGLFVLTPYTTDELNSLMPLKGPTFILVMLPPIIFEGGYSLKKIYFFRNFGLILMLALVGTTVSAFIIGGFIYLFANYLGMNPVNVPFAEAMALGSLLSATDPVASLAVFSNLGVDRTLYTLVYGESNLNDAIGIVLFQTSMEFVGAGEHVHYDALKQFIGVTLFAPLIGAGIGLFAALIFKYAKFDLLPVVESLMFWGFSYLSYLLGEAPKFSGIISTLFCGFVMRHYAYHNLSERGRELSSDLIKALAVTFDTLIFINIGIAPFAFQTTWDPYLISITIVLCIVSRFIAVYSLCGIANVFRKCKCRPNVQRVGFKKQTVLFHAGLRGAVAFVLALQLVEGTQDSSSKYWIATVLAVILFTVFTLGGTTGLLLKVLNIRAEGEKTHITSMNTSYAEVFYPWETKYVARIFVRKSRMEELEQMIDEGNADQEDIIKDKMTTKHTQTNYRPSYSKGGYYTAEEVKYLTPVGSIQDFNDLDDPFSGYQTH